MDRYLLFLNGFFNKREDIEYFSNFFIEKIKIVKSMKVIIENIETIILIFDSESEEETVFTEIDTFLSESEIKVSFLFNSKNLIGTKIPHEIKHILLNKTTPDDSIIFIEIVELEYDLNLDEILEKIKNFGIKSLTNHEKKFLDNFKK